MLAKWSIIEMLLYNYTLHMHVAYSIFNLVEDTMNKLFEILLLLPSFQIQAEFITMHDLNRMVHYVRI